MTGLRLMSLFICIACYFNRHPLCLSSIIRIFADIIS